jgi:hypothetical protein
MNLKTEVCTLRKDGWPKTPSRKRPRFETFAIVPFNSTLITSQRDNFQVWTTAIQAYHIA